MARAYYLEEPSIINSVSGGENLPVLYFATTNLNKIKEIKRILIGVDVRTCDIKVDEIQSLDPYEVVEKKAIEAWRKNKFNPVLVEDVSLEISGLGNRPGTFINQFGGGDIEIRRLIAETWLVGKDRSARARTIYAIYDGKEVCTWEGVVTGQIAEKLSSGNGFGFDDIFIPDGQKKLKINKNKKHISGRTFAVMTDDEKDELSMRGIALRKLAKDLPNLKLSEHVLMLPEPYTNELLRVQVDKLQDKKAIDFAYKLECLESEYRKKKNSSNNKLTASNYTPVLKEENIFFTRYLQSKKSHSLSLMTRRSRLLKR
jgi:XTP/dITP diphosphohydrolase